MNHSPEITTVLFDKDWVFLDSEIINVISHDFAMAVQWILLNDEDKLDLYGKNWKDWAQILSNKWYEFDKEAYMKLKSFYYRYHLDKAEIFTEVVEFAKRLKEEWYTLAMVTSMEDQSTKESIKKLWLEEIFDVVITSDDCENRKPDKEPYEKAMKALWVSPEECLVIEDSPVWITSAQWAWIKCMVIKSPHVREEDISDADYMLTDKSLLAEYELEEIIGKLAEEKIQKSLDTK